MPSKKARRREDRQYSATSPERDKPMCSIVWIMCRNCPDLIDGKCKWVKE